MCHEYTVRYGDHEAMGVAIAMQAHQLQLTPEQLIRRILARELGDVGISASTIKRETDPRTCWVRNGVLMPHAQKEVSHEAAAS